MLSQKRVQDEHTSIANDEGGTDADYYFSVTYGDYFGGSMAFGYFAGLQLNTL